MTGLSDEAKRRLALLGAEGPGADAEARVRQGLERALGVTLPVGGLVVTSGAAAGSAAASGAATSGAATSGAATSGAATSGAATSGAATSGAATGGATASGAAASGAAASSVATTATASVGTVAASAAAGGGAAVASGSAAAAGSGWLIAAIAGVIVSAGAGIGYATLGPRSPAPAPSAPAVIDTRTPDPVEPAAPREVPRADDVAPPEPVAAGEPLVQDAPVALDAPSPARRPTAATPAAAPKPSTAPPPTTEPAPATEPALAEAPGVTEPPLPSPNDEAQQLDPELTCDGDAELRFAQAAERHLERADAAHALALLDTFGRRCPSGHWSELTWAVRLGSLCTLGRAREASQLVAWHREEHPRDTARLLERTQRWCAARAE